MLFLIFISHGSRIVNRLYEILIVGLSKLSNFFIAVINQEYYSLFQISKTIVKTVVIPMVADAVSLDSIWTKYN